MEFHGEQEQKQSNQTFTKDVAASDVDDTTSSSAPLSHQATSDPNLALISTSISTNLLGGPGDANTFPRLLDIPDASVVSYIGSSNQTSVNLEYLRSPEVQTCTADPGSVQSATEVVLASVPQILSETDTGYSDVEYELKDAIVTLKAMMGDLGSQHFPASDRILLDRVINEIETWMNEGPGVLMGYNAQLALLYTTGNPVAKSELWDSDAEDGKQSLDGYVSLLRDAAINDTFSDEEREMFSTAIEEFKEALNVPRDASIEMDYHAQLSILHRIFDGYVARHSVEMATRFIKHIETNNLFDTSYAVFRTSQLNSVGRLRAIQHNREGISAFERFERFGEVKDLNEAIAQFREAVSLTPLDSAHLPRYLNNLGSLFIRRFERFGEVKDIDAAIERQTDAVNLDPLDSANRPAYLNNLGISFMRRFERFGEVKDIDAAIERQTEAVNLTPLDSDDRSGHLNNLGMSYMDRFGRFGEVDDIEAAIERQTEAVDLIPLDSVDRPRFLCNLGNSFQSRFERFGEVKDIDAAIERQTEAVDLTPSDSADRPNSLSNLGLSFMRRFERFGEVKDIDAAIERQTEAVNLIPLDSADRPGHYNNLGISYTNRFEVFGEVKDIDAAIRRQTEAVDFTPLDSADRPEYLNNLGISFMRRFERFGEVKDIDAAIERQTEAVSLDPLDSADRHGHLNNLGTSFMRRFERFEEVKDIDAAIERQTEAVGLTPLDSANRPGYLNNLGNSLIGRFERFGEVKDIDAAIEQQTEAVNLEPLNSADRPGYLNNLGTLFLRRFERFGEVKDIDAAIERQIEAVDLTPLDNANRPINLSNLGISFMRRFEQFEEVKDIDAAIERQTEAVNLTPLDSTDRPGHLNNLGVSFLCRFERFGEIKDQQQAANAFLSSSHSKNGKPIALMLASLKYSRIMHLCEEFFLASKGYIRAVHLLPQVVWIGLDAVSQLKQFSSDIQSFGCDAAACMFSRAESEHDHEQLHLGHAVEILDQTRSVLWSQASNLRQDLGDLRLVEPRLAEELDRVGRTLGQSYFRDPNRMFSEVEEQNHRRCAEKWEELVLSARRVPGFDHFLLPLPISKLREAAKGGPAVIVNVSKYRSDALIISPNGQLELVPLSPETETRVNALSRRRQQIIPSGRSRDGYLWDGIPSTQDDLFLEVLYETWTLVGEPIAKKFEESRILGSGMSSKRRLWWCLTGQLAFLPVHACLPRPIKAEIRPVGMMDIAVSSYTPTLSTLLRAVQQKATRPFRMLAIGQPKSRNHPPLSYVTEEIEFICDLLPHDTIILKSSDADVDAVNAALPTCTWAHFACHGIQSHNDPLESGLLLHNDQLLTLSFIAQNSLEGAEFAFLSSCESATGSKLMPNESVHLAAGLQFLGFRGVIGTMWSVKDEDAFYVAKAVYEQLLGNGPSCATASDAALALHLAVCRLRDEKKVPLAQWVPFIHFGF